MFAKLWDRLLCCRCLCSSKSWSLQHGWQQRVSLSKSFSNFVSMRPRIKSARFNSYITRMGLCGDWRPGQLHFISHISSDIKQYSEIAHDGKLHEFETNELHQLIVDEWEQRISLTDAVKEFLVEEEDLAGKRCYSD